MFGENPVSLLARGFLARALRFVAVDLTPEDVARFAPPQTVICVLAQLDADEVVPGPTLMEPKEPLHTGAGQLARKRMPPQHFRSRPRRPVPVADQTLLSPAGYLPPMLMR